MTKTQPAAGGNAPGLSDAELRKKLERLTPHQWRTILCVVRDLGDLRRAKSVRRKAAILQDIGKNLRDVLPPEDAEKMVMEIGGIHNLAAKTIGRAAA